MSTEMSYTFPFCPKMFLLTLSKLRHQMESKIKQFNIWNSQTKSLHGFIWTDKTILKPNLAPIFSSYISHIVPPGLVLCHGSSCGPSSNTDYGLYNSFASLQCIIMHNQYSFNFTHHNAVFAGYDKLIINLS